MADLFVKDLPRAAQRERIRDAVAEERIERAARRYDESNQKAQEFEDRTGHFAGVVALNEEQEAVAELGDGAFLVDAAAGVGKTTAVTERTIRLVQKGVNPDRILQVTFTVKAAQEMADRVFKRTGRRPMWATNFHRLCTRLLRQFPDLGMPQGFGIADTDDVKKIIRGLLKEAAPGADIRKYTGYIQAQVTRNRELTMWPDGDPLTFWAKKDPLIVALAEAYEDRLREDNKIDFDLMLYKVAEGLRNNDEVRRRIAALWDYIMVDEFQDTDPVQLDILKSICPHGNVVGVGDMDQGVYRFRGAEPRNMQYFVAHFRAKVLPLQINYRSKEEILDLANKVIKNNPDRYEKALRPSRGPGGKVRLRRFLDSKAEAEFIASEIKAMIRSGTVPEQIAVLYRVGAASRSVETALARAGIRHRVLGGLRFWDRREVKDVIAYAKVLLGRHDWEAWERAAQNPRLGIGAAGWQKARAAGKPEDGLAVYHPQRSARLLVSLAQARAKGLGADALELLLDRAGYNQQLIEECSSSPEELAQRMSNVHETVAAIREMGSIETFLDEVVLGIPERDTEEAKKGVVLATIHAAKGLEWDQVFLVAVAEEIMPHSFAIRGGDDDMAEERRLMYVAITRARQGLGLSYPTYMDQPGAASKIVMPSRFLSEAEMMNRVEKYQ